MKRLLKHSIFCALAVVPVAVSSVVAADGVRYGPLTPGLYVHKTSERQHVSGRPTQPGSNGHAAYECGVSQLLRFYQDGTVLYATACLKSEEKETDVLGWFQRGNKRGVNSEGKYQLSGRQISFLTLSPSGVEVRYQGSVKNGFLILDSISSNGHQEKGTEFHQVWVEKQKEPANKSLKPTAPRQP